MEKLEDVLLGLAFLFWIFLLAIFSGCAGIIALIITATVEGS